ncbi:MAG: VOC family protein [Salibacteraceae bacterium]
MKKRVIGIGGIFFKSQNPAKLKEWYSKHLGIDSDQYGSKFVWRAAEGAEMLKTTVWSPMPEDTDYYDPGDQRHMINYRVSNLVELLQVLKSEGVEQVGKMEEYEYGKFAWVLDPDGVKVELWEPSEESLFHEPPMIKSE